MSKSDITGLDREERRQRALVAALDICATGGQTASASLCEEASRLIVSLRQELRERVSPPPDDNVVVLGGVTLEDIPAERVLEAARGQCPGGVIVIGEDADDELYLASSMADMGVVILLLELAKMAVLDAKRSE